MQVSTSFQALLRNEKRLNEKAFIEDFSTLPLNLVYSVDDPDQKLEIFTSIFKSCLERHAPVRRVKITCPPAPWLNTDNIRQLQKECNQLRHLVYKKTTINGISWYKFREVRNKIKTKIKQVKRCFYEKALSSSKPRVMANYPSSTLLRQTQMC